MFARPFRNFVSRCLLGHHVGIVTLRGKHSVVSNTTLIDGNAIHYEKVGRGAHDVLFISGALGSAETDFQHQMEYIASSSYIGDKFTAYFIDLPGYGKSIPPERTWPSKFFDVDAETCYKFMQKHAKNSYSLAGWSDGGIVSLLMAVRYSRVLRKVVIWGANSYIDPVDINMYESIRDLDKWSPRMREPYEKLYGKEYFRIHWNAWIDAMTNYPDRDICKNTMDNITAPLFIIHGEKDAVCPSFHPRYIHDQVVGSKIRYEPEWKHNLHMRHKDQFNKLVFQFLNDSLV